MWIFAFWCLFELFGFFVFLSEIFVKTSRIHSDSHSLWILKCFLVFFKLFFVLGLGFWTEQLELAMDSHRLRFCSDFFNVIRGGLRVTWVCYSEILVRSSDSLVRILAGELSFFFSDPTLWNPSLLSLSSSLISRCDHACSALLPVACSRLDCSFTSSMMKILVNLWELAGNSYEFASVLILCAEFRGWIEAFCGTVLN